MMRRTRTILPIPIIQRAIIVCMVLLATTKQYFAAGAFTLTAPLKDDYILRHSITQSTSPVGYSTKLLAKHDNIIIASSCSSDGIIISSPPSSFITTTSASTTRREFLTTSTFIASSSSFAFQAYADENNNDDDDGQKDASSSSSSFESIAARAARVSQEVTDSERAQQQVVAEAEAAAAQERRQELAQKLKEDVRTIYDFTLPVNGKAREISDLIGQTFGGGDSGDGWTDSGEGESSTPGTMNGGKIGTRVKAILVVNMKQDDPIARKNIPELIELVTRFGKKGEFAVIMSPTDQGYYEPDTSALLRLKLEQEYGYGNSPGTILSDKVNLLGTGAVPFWRWIEGSCRTPAGLGKIQANFEKFLVDGRTGKPLRRYPRKYQPYDIADDISALIQGKPLPPAGSNFKEEWRNAAKEAENDTYRFQKGLNYFDQ